MVQFRCYEGSGITRGCRQRTTLPRAGRHGRHGRHGRRMAGMAGTAGHGRAWQAWCRKAPCLRHVKRGVRLLLIVPARARSRSGLPTSGAAAMARGAGQSARRQAATTWYQRHQAPLPNFPGSISRPGQARRPRRRRQRSMPAERAVADDPGLEIARQVQLRGPGAPVHLRAVLMPRPATGGSGTSPQEAMGYKSGLQTGKTCSRSSYLVAGPQRTLQGRALSLASIPYRAKSGSSIWIMALTETSGWRAEKSRACRPATWSTAIRWPRQSAALWRRGYRSHASSSRARALPGRRSAALVPASGDADATNARAALPAGGRPGFPPVL